MHFLLFVFLTFFLATTVRYFVQVHESHAQTQHSVAMSSLTQDNQHSQMSAQTTKRSGLEVKMSLGNL